MSNSVIEIIEQPVEVVVSNGTVTFEVLQSEVVVELGNSGPQGPEGPTGATGATGAGVPAGGTTGQILAKTSDTNYDTAWIENYANWTSTIKQPVKNNGVASLSKGMPVYVTGANGANVLVGKASASSEATSSKTLGLLEQDLDPQGQGYVIVEGILQGLNTSAAAAGDPVWLSPTAGELIYGLANKPYAPNHLVFIGVVVRAHQNQGAIAIKPQNGFEMKEIHDISAMSPADNDSLRYQASTGLWRNIKSEFVHVQNSVSTDWSIAHNMDMFPQVSVVDSAGTNVEGSVEYLNRNSLVVHFAYGFTGFAYLS